MSCIQFTTILILKGLKGFEQILVLSIEKPGVSGQKFNEKSFKLIEKINSLKIEIDFLYALMVVLKAI